MQFCREIADQVCFLDAGRILERGTPDAVFGAPTEPRTREFLARVRT
jgi:polar amino acid transport system ATP-binding protein